MSDKRFYFDVGPDEQLEVVVTEEGIIANLTNIQDEDSDVLTWGMTAAEISEKCK